MRKTLILFLLLLLTIGCTEKLPNPTDLYTTYKNSVVLIKNSCYFKVTLGNGFDFFYIIDDTTKKPIFFSEEKEVIKNAGVSYGTGFFVSNKGEIATNRHVVFPDKREKAVRKEMVSFFTKLRADIKKVINEKRSEQTELMEIWDQYYDYLDPKNKSEIKHEFSSQKKALLKFKKSLDKLDFNPEHIDIDLKRVFLGVAFDGARVELNRGFNKCKFIKKSDEVDLAIIQLVTRKTPRKVNSIFKLEDYKSVKIPQLNEQVFMIGFNNGITLANTANGVKSQFTQGKVTQEPDNKRVLYSIPTLLGSSGSPVIDKWGNLIAVNYAKIADVQGFSFGVSHLALTNLYNQPIDKTPVKTPKKTKVSVLPSQKEFENNVKAALSLQLKEKPKPKKIFEEEALESKEVVFTQFHSQVKDFLVAEEQRDFKKILSFLSPKRSRFYNVPTVEYLAIKNYYESLWNAISDERNYVKSIDKINEYLYELNAEYKYYNNKTRKGFTGDNTLRFLFDTKGKIIQVYSVKKDASLQDSKTALNPTKTHLNSSSQKKQDALTNRDEVISFQSQIKNFLVAEEQRDLDKILSFLSPNRNRFYSITPPDDRGLKYYYNALWQNISEERNYVKSIQNIEDNLYELHTEYKYYDNRVHKGVTDLHTVRFLFDSKGKIIQVYTVKQDTLKYM